MLGETWMEGGKRAVGLGTLRSIQDWDEKDGVKPDRRTGFQSKTLKSKFATWNMKPHRVDSLPCRQVV